MHDRPIKFNSSAFAEDAWRDELELFEYDRGDLDTASCAGLSDELFAFEIQAESDPNFEDSFATWHCHILDERLWLVLEQSCHEGVLLPIEQIHLRLKTCPRPLRDGLWHFLGHCPTHVKHYLALQFWILIRIDRARRTGNSEWRPAAT